jgi:ABC-type glycerol-3-phosphate transport system permease component
MWTVIAVGLINACLAYGLAHLVAPGRAPTVSIFIVGIAVVAALVSVVVAVRGWRGHARRGRVVS